MSSAGEFLPATGCIQDLPRQMVFPSQIFLFAFLPMVLAVYYLAGRRYRNVVLLAFSYIFYVWGSGHFFVIVVLYHDSFMQVPLRLIRGSFERIDTPWSVSIPTLEGVEEDELIASDIVIVEIVERDIRWLDIKTID